MSLQYEEAKSFAIELAKALGEPVILVGETLDDHEDGEAQECINPDGTTIQGILEAGVGNCTFVQFPFDCLKKAELSWKISFKGIRLDSLDPLRLIMFFVPRGHGWYPDPENMANFERLDTPPCSCGAHPKARIVVNNGHVCGQLYCPQCGHEGPVEALEGDAAEGWSESLK